MNSLKIKIKPAHQHGAFRKDVVIWLACLWGVVSLNALYFDNYFEVPGSVEDTTVAFITGPFTSNNYSFPGVESSFVKPISLYMNVSDRPFLGVVIEYKNPELGRVISAYVELLDAQGKVIYADKLEYEDPRNDLTVANNDLNKANSRISRAFRFRTPPDKINQIKVTFSLMKKTL